MAERVLFLVDTLAKGGLAHVIVTVANRMRQRGITVGIAVLDGIVDHVPDDLVWLRRNPQGRQAGDGKRFRDSSADFGLQASASFEAEMGAADLIIAAGETALRCAPQWQHQRLVFSSHSSQLGAPKHEGWRGKLRHRFKQWRRGRRLKHLLNGRHVHVVSNGLADELRKTFGVRPASLDVIPNPFDIDSIRALSRLETPECRQVSAPFVVGVGAFSENKHFDRLIHAFSASGIEGELVLIGQGPEETALRALAQSLGVAQRTHFIPFHPNHYALVARANLLALTSNSEGLGNVLIEALILGVPALSTDCPHGPRDILGKLDPRALVALDRLERLPERLRDLVRHPYPIPESCVERYELDHVVEQYLALADRFGQA